MTLTSLRVPLSLLSLLFSFLVLGVACTSQKNSSAQIASQDGTANEASLLGKAGVTVRECGADDVAVFERADGLAFNTDLESLPKGLYLATVSELLLEKRKDGRSPEARLLAREVSSGTEAEIACSENVEAFGESFEWTMTGLVKFDTSQGTRGAGLTTRQFYVFSGKSGHGVVLSTPRLGRPQDLREALTAQEGTQLVKLSDRSFLVRQQKERDGVRARLLVHLEFISADE